MSKKAYSEDMQRWHRGALNRIMMELEDGKEVYTHHFEYMDGQWAYGFRGKEGRRHLLKCLWSLEEAGLIQHTNIGMNIYKWKKVDK